MQNLKLIQEDELDTKLLFLHELINTFTRKLNIKSRNFYSKINKDLKHNPILSRLSYSGQGLLQFESIFNDYKMIKKSGKGVYQIAPYFSSLTRLLTSIYKEVAGSLGEEETKKILKNSFKIVKNKYSEIPDLEGYVPREVLGGAIETETSPTYNTILMDNLIKYLVDVIKKVSVKPKQIITKIKPSKEQIAEQIKYVYTETLGPLGFKQFQKIEKDLNLNTIIQQIEEFESKGILNEKESNEFKNEIKTLFEG